jgi:hypothetical protein
MKIQRFPLALKRLAARAQFLALSSDAKTAAEVVDGGKLKMSMRRTFNEVVALKP